MKKLQGFFIVTWFCGCLIFLLFQIVGISNTRDLMSFLLCGLLVGVLIGASITYSDINVLFKPIVTPQSDRNDIWAAKALMWVGALALGLSLFSYFNYSLSEIEFYEDSTILDKKYSKSPKSGESWQFTIKSPVGIENISVHPNDFNKYTVGEKYVLRIRKGYFGWSVVMINR